MNLAILPKCTQANQHATAAYTLDRVARWEAGERLTLWEEAPLSSGSSKPMNANQREARATMLCKEQMDAKACAFLTAPDMAEANETSVRKLRVLHPEALPPRHLDILDLPLPLDIAVRLVYKMLRTFPRGSAPGPTGLRPQHILDALTPADKTALLEQLTAVVRMLATGQAPEQVAPFFA